jgi:hypothetical protein
MRPKSIIYFERIMFGTLAMGLIQAVLGWNRNIEIASHTSRSPTTFVLLTNVFTFSIIAVLVVLISRGRSRVVAWISLVMTVLGIPGFIAVLAQGLPGSTAIAAVQLVGQVVAFAYLFSPSARLWLRTKPRKLAQSTPTPA